MRIRIATAALLGFYYLITPALATPSQSGYLETTKLAQLPPPPFAGGGPDCCDGFGGPGEGGDFPPPPPGHLGFGPMMMHGPHGAPPMMPFPPDVELSDDQVEKMAQIKKETKEKATPIAGKLSSLEHELSLLLSAETLNQGEISQQSAEINEQKRLLDGIFTQSRVQMAQVLTPEQRHKIRLFTQRRELGPLGRKKPPSTTINTK